MVTADDYTYCDEHWVLNRIAESLRFTPETNITYYVNYTSIKLKQSVSFFFKWIKPLQGVSHYFQSISMVI